MLLTAIISIVGCCFTLSSILYPDCTGSLLNLTFPTMDIHTPTQRNDTSVVNKNFEPHSTTRLRYTRERLFNIRRTTRCLWRHGAHTINSFRTLKLHLCCIIVGTKPDQKLRDQEVLSIDRLLVPCLLILVPLIQRTW